MYTKEDIFKLVEEEDVSFIRLQFTDMYGAVKNIAITVSQLDKALDNRFSFDSSRVKGFEGAEGEPMYLYPNLDTFQIFPWRPHQGKVARFICGICGADGKPFEDNPRYILERALERAKKLGYTFIVRPQCEFYLFKTDDDGKPVIESGDKGGFFDVAPLDNGENCRRDIILSLEDMGFEAEMSYHEEAAGQHEIELPSDTALEAADKIISFRMVVKTIAKRNGLHATFMAKPIFGEKGSGMHLGMTILKDGENVLFENGELSEKGRNFAAGILNRMGEMACITNPTVNSYKRLPEKTDGTDCGYFMKKTENGMGMLKFCLPDSMSNPYLVIAACLNAGLEGIEKKTEPNEECKLPESLSRALDCAENSKFVTGLLGKKLHETYIKEKRKEAEEYGKTVTPWEINKYFMQY